MRTGKKVYGGVIDLETGELVEDYDVYRYETKSEHENKQDFMRQSIIKKYRDEVIQQWKADQKKQGDFIWGVCEPLKNWHLEISSSNLMRLIYLATYVGYDGYLRWGKEHGGRRMTKNVCKAVLRVSPRCFDSFWREMVEKNILFESESPKGVTLNPSYFFKGKAKEEGNRIRIFINTTRSLYRSTPPNGHKSLSFLYRLIPLVNYRYNIVCSNPAETNLAQVKPLSAREICSFLGYSAKNSGRLKKYICETKIYIDGKEQMVAKYLKKEDKNFGIFVNPLIYYRGANSRRVQEMGEFEKNETEASSLRRPEKKKDKSKLETLLSFSSSTGILTWEDGTPLSRNDIGAVLNLSKLEVEDFLRRVDSSLIWADPIQDGEGYFYFENTKEEKHLNDETTTN